jgi:hypothetical protein
MREGPPEGGSGGLHELSTGAIGDATAMQLQLHTYGELMDSVYSATTTGCPSTTMAGFSPPAASTG